MHVCEGVTKSGCRCKRKLKSAKFCKTHSEQNNSVNRVAIIQHLDDKLDINTNVKIDIDIEKSYVQNVKKSLDWVLMIGRELLDDHGLNHWIIKFDRSKLIYGTTCYENSTITISKPLAEISDDTNILNTLTHEIAHALCPGHEHDETWKKTHQLMGGDGKICCDAKIPDSFYKWRIVCQKCEQVCNRLHRYSSAAVNNYKCADCDGKLKIEAI